MGAKNYTVDKITALSAEIDSPTLYVDSVNHKIGIGTTEPTKLLTISSNISQRAGMQFFDTSATSPGNVLFYTAYGNFYLSPSSGLTRFFQSGVSHAIEMYDSATKNIRLATNGDSYFLGGNVGIGTASPATQLQIGALTSTADQFISMLTEGGDVAYLSSGLKLRLHTNDYGWDILSANRASSQAGLDIIRHNNSSTGVSAFFINLTTGSIGIGTTTPAGTASLEINSLTTDAYSGLRINRNGTPAQYISIGTYGDHIIKCVGASKNFILQNSSTTAGNLQLQAGGNLGLTVGFDGNTLISNNLTVDKKLIETKTAKTISGATDEIPCTSSYVALNYSGNVTLITNNVIDVDGAVDGQVLHVVNAGSDSVITLTGWVAVTSEYSKVTFKNGAASLALTRNATAGKADGSTFIFNSTVGRWLEV